MALVSLCAAMIMKTSHKKLPLNVLAAGPGSPTLVFYYFLVTSEVVHPSVTSTKFASLEQNGRPLACTLLQDIILEPSRLESSGWPVALGNHIWTTVNHFV